MFFYSPGSPHKKGYKRPKRKLVVLLQKSVRAKDLNMQYLKVQFVPIVHSQAKLH